MLSVTKQEMIKESIRNSLLNIDDYSFEIMASDVWCLHNSMFNNFDCEKIFITQKVRDLGIDSIVIPSKNVSSKERYYYLLQVSKVSKSVGNLKNFMDKKSMEKYFDIIPVDCKYEKRVLITLKNSNVKQLNVEIISGEKLVDMIYAVGTNYNLIDINGNIIEEYLNNIEVRAEVWELVNIYRKKHKYQLVDEYLKVLIANYNLLEQKSFSMLASMNFIIEHKMRETLDYVTTGDNKEKCKLIIMTKFSVVAEETFLKYKSDVEQLVKFILENINYDLVKYEIVPRCSYLSLKVRKNNSVVAYFSYGYNNKETKSFNFGFKCNIEDISEAYINNAKIRIQSEEEKISDSCSFKTPVLLNNPDLIDDYDLINELIYKSEIKISK